MIRVLYVTWPLGKKFISDVWEVKEEPRCSDPCWSRTSQGWSECRGKTYRSDSCTKQSQSFGDLIEGDVINGVGARKPVVDEASPWNGDTFARWYILRQRHRKAVGKVQSVLMRSYSRHLLAPSRWSCNVLSDLEFKDITILIGHVRQISTSSRTSRISPFYSHQD